MTPDLQGVVCGLEMDIIVSIHAIDENTVISEITVFVKIGDGEEDFVSNLASGHCDIIKSRVAGSFEPGLHVDLRCHKI